MVESLKRYKVYSKSQKAFLTNARLNHFKVWNNNCAKTWKLFSPVLEFVERAFCGKQWFSYDKIEHLADADDLEIVEYDVILEEVARHSVTPLIIDRERERQIRRNFGYQVYRMYLKMKEQGDTSYRYILSFGTTDSGYRAFREARIRLKELDIDHVRSYLFTRNVMIFREANDAILCRLSFADDVSDIYDIQTLRNIDAKEYDKHREQTKPR